MSDKKHTEIHGPWRFRMHRQGAEGRVEAVADGVMFSDGACVLRWTTKTRSTGLYDHFEQLASIHGHEGTTFEWIEARPTEAFARGRSDCYQDDCENCAFSSISSIGGKEARANPQAPRYIAESESSEYLRGYVAQAREMYGEDWATCTFGWVGTISIGGDA